MINTNGDISADPQVYLIDFGFADKFNMEDSKEHFEFGTQVDKFEGNLLFAGLNQMNFMKTSRRDDMISIFYLIIYLLNGEKYHGLQLYEDIPVNEQFQQVK